MSAATMARIQIAVLFIAIIAAGLIYKGLRSIDREIAELRSEVDALKKGVTDEGDSEDREVELEPEPESEPQAVTEPEIQPEIVPEPEVQEIINNIQTILDKDDDAITSWKVDRLKEFLKLHGKSTRGNRDQLIERALGVHQEHPTSDEAE